MHATSTMEIHPGSSIRFQYDRSKMNMKYMIGIQLPILLVKQTNANIANDYTLCTAYKALYNPNQPKSSYTHNVKWIRDLNYLSLQRRQP